MDSIVSAMTCCQYSVCGHTTALVILSKRSRCGVRAGCALGVTIVCAANFCTALIASSSLYRWRRVSYSWPLMYGITFMPAACMAFTLSLQPERAGK
jgi:hypothetical protein